MYVQAPAPWPALLISIGEATKEITGTQNAWLAILREEVPFACEVY